MVWEASSVVVLQNWVSSNHGLDDTILKAENYKLAIFYNLAHLNMFVIIRINLDLITCMILTNYTVLSAILMSITSFY